jgi:transposase
MNPSAGTPVILGIDISKEWIDAHMLPAGKTWRIANDAKELKNWAEQLPKGITIAILEATGGLETLPAVALAQAKIPTAIVNPKQVRAFAQAMGQQAKSDPIDAKLIALFGEKIQPKAKSLPEQEHADLAELLARRRQLVADKVAEQNRLGSMRSRQAQKSINAHIQWLTKQIERIDKQLDDMIQNSPLWLVKEQLLTTVRGIGPQTARSMIVHMPELGQLNRKQIASLAGLAPFTRESGKWKGKRFIGGGRKEVRNALYMATLTATRCNPTIARSYRTLRNQGKPHKVALTACMRKMLTIMNAIVRDQKPWDENYEIA